MTSFELVTVEVHDAMIGDAELRDVGGIGSAQGGDPAHSGSEVRREAGQRHRRRSARKVGQNQRARAGVGIANAVRVDGDAAALAGRRIEDDANRLHRPGEDRAEGAVAVHSCGGDLAGGWPLLPQGAKAEPAARIVG
jgi:hypothetical protein